MRKIQFDAIGGDWINPPVLMPASLPLELSGEAIRSRLLTISDSPGDELALRPDLTLAVANHHIQSGGDQPVSYRYYGKAFRQPVQAGDPMEFYQTGFESFGHPDRGARDVATLAMICETIAEAGLERVNLRLGNVSVFSHFVEALQLSTYWTEQLNRAFRRQEGIRKLLAEREAIPRSALAQTLAELPEDRAEALLQDVLAMSGGEVIGGRTQEDILLRLQARAEAAREGVLPDRARRLLGELIELEGRPEEVLSRLRNMSQASQLDLGSALNDLSDLFTELDARKLPFWDGAHFSIQFGRRFDYYDGLVFELQHERLGRGRPVASGGRYDGLIGRLSGGTKSMPAVGAVLRPDRIDAAQMTEGGAA